MALNPYNLGDFNSGTYTPFVCNISSITRAAQALVTTSITHGFVVGNTVRFFIPQQYGMRQLDGLKGTVMTVPADDEFTVNIDTQGFDPFVTPSLPPYVVIDPAQVAGIGDMNYGNLSPGGIPVLPITVPGAYQNQPP